LEIVLAAFHSKDKINHYSKNMSHIFYSISSLQCIGYIRKTVYILSFCIYYDKPFYGEQYSKSLILVIKFEAPTMQGGRHIYVYDIIFIYMSARTEAFASTD
jgi:hypothetical protein